MPKWISDGKGFLYPSKESVGLKNLSDKPLTRKMKDITGKEFTISVPPGGDYVYEGPDRAALYQWWEENGRPDSDKMKEMEGQVKMGEDFKVNPEFVKQYSNARQMFGFNSVDEYLKYLGFDENKLKKQFDEKASIVNVHDMPKRIPESKMIGGGKNYGKDVTVQDMYGGFGDPPNM